MIFASDRIKLHPQARVVQRSTTLLGGVWLSSVSERHDVQALELFQFSEPPAYGIAAAFSEGNDVPYAALMTAATAAHAQTRAEDTQSGEWVASIRFPVVITEASLFLCSLGKSSEPILEEATRATLVWRNPVYRRPNCIIDVVHASAVETFVRSVRSSFDFLLTKSDKEFANAVAQFPTAPRIPSRQPRRARKKK